MNDRAPIRDRTLVLRILVPGLEARLRDKMKDMEDTAAATSSSSSPSHRASSSSVAGRTTGNNNNTTTATTTTTTTASNTKDLYLDLEGVTCEPTTARGGTLWNFHCDGATYPARLVNLPCPVELHKTHDHAAYYKAADVAQMLIVYEDDMALEEDDSSPPVEGFPSYFHSGLTPPMRKVVERRFSLREHKAVAPPRAAMADVELELIELMEKLSKDEKGKRNKVPTLTSANKTLEEVEEEVVEYEPWMSDFGRQPHGIEFEADDQLCSLHPEVWLSAAEIHKIKEQAEEERRKKEAAVQKKEAKRKEKREKSIKKGIPAKKNQEEVDEITQAATMLQQADITDIMATLGDEDLFGDLDFDNDMNFDGVQL